MHVFIFILFYFILFYFILFYDNTLMNSNKKTNGVLSFNRIQKPNEILQSQTYLYRQIKDQRKLSIILANENELLDLQYTQKYFSRKKIEKFDIHNNEKDDADIQIVLSKMIPMLDGFTLNYLGNYLIGLLPNIKYFPHNSDVTFITQIGPGEIKNKKLFAYEDRNHFFEKYLSCKTTSMYQYISWDNIETFDEFIHNYPAILKKNISLNVPSIKTNNVVVSYVDLFKKDVKFNEMYSFPMNLYFIVMALKTLKKGGDLFYFYSACKYETTCQLLNIISSKFKGYTYIDNYFNNRDGIYKFSNYTGNAKDLEEILKEYMKLDKTLGQKYITNDNAEHIFFNFNIQIDNDFLFFLKKIAIKQHDECVMFIKKVSYISNMIKNPKKIYQIIDSNIEHCIDYVNKFKLIMSPYYTNHFDKLNNIGLKKQMFPVLTLKQNDFKKLKLSTESLYSVSMPFEAQIITNLIRKYYPFAKTIADMNANVGGNSINFCTAFNFVYSIELDKYTSELLKNNLNTYKFKNFEVINDDCMKFNKPSDVYFYDPPWTGIFYGMDTKISLYFGNTNVVDILKPNFCIKVPNNYDVYELLQKFPNIHIHKVKNFMIIINIVYSKNTPYLKNKKTKKNKKN
jgi:predicted RNA methylase